jgi:hypothetical protein
MHSPELEQDLYQALGVARNAGDKEVRAPSPPMLLF